jgi:hypothetical protein
MRRPVYTNVSAASLELGEASLDGRPLVYSRGERRFDAVLLCRGTCAIVSAVLVILFFAYGTHIVCAQTRSEIQDLVAKSFPVDTCAHFRTRWINTVVLSDLDTIMVSPALLSHGYETKRTDETPDGSGCKGKTIQRDRYTMVTVSYIPLEHWPWKRSRRLITIRDKPAMCVQHAIEDFAFPITC